MSRIDLFPGDLLTPSVPLDAPQMSYAPAEEAEPAPARFRAASTA